MLDIFKTKDYRLEFENRCRSKVEEKVLKTRVRRGEERAKLEENIRKSVCACIAPHANRDLEIVWKAISPASSAMFGEGVRIPRRPVIPYEEVEPTSKSDFDRRCSKKIEFLKNRYTGKKSDEIGEVGRSICKCVSENVLPFVGRDQPVFATAMYDAENSLRDEKTIKKFKEKMTLEAMRKRGEIP